MRLRLSIPEDAAAAAIGPKGGAACATDRAHKDSRESTRKTVLWWIRLGSGSKDNFNCRHQCHLHEPIKPIFGGIPLVHLTDGVKKAEPDALALSILQIGAQPHNGGLQFSFFRE